MKTSGAGVRLERPLALFALACLGCSGPPEGSWCEPDTGGVEVSFSTGPGAWKRDGRSAELEELWRAGGLREGEELAFLVGAVASPGGRLAIGDFELGEAIVLEADGSWLGPWATRGEGPGELSSAVAANWDRRDGSLVVFDFTGAKVVFLLDGQPVRDEVRVAPAPLSPILASGAMAWAGVQPSGGVLVQPVPAGDRSERERRRSVILYLAPGTEVADTLASAWSHMLGGPAPYASLPAPGWPRLVAAVGTDGWIALGGFDGRYRVLLLDEQGRLRRDVGERLQGSPPAGIATCEGNDSPGSRRWLRLRYSARLRSQVPSTRNRQGVRCTLLREGPFVEAGPLASHSCSPVAEHLVGERPDLGEGEPNRPAPRKAGSGVPGPYFHTPSPAALPQLPGSRRPRRVDARRAPVR